MKRRVMTLALLMSAGAAWAALSELDAVPDGNKGE